MNTDENKESTILTGEMIEAADKLFTTYDPEWDTPHEALKSLCANILGLEVSES